MSNQKIQYMMKNHFLMVKQKIDKKFITFLYEQYCPNTFKMTNEVISIFFFI